MILGSNEVQDQRTCHIQEWQLWLFLLLELSPLLVFEFDFLSLFCNMNTLRNILMMLGTNVEQDEMTCCLQEWQLWLDCGRHLFFFSKKPFLVMPPTLKKVGRHIAFGLSVHLVIRLCIRLWVRVFVHSFVTLSGAKHNYRTWYANVLKFHIWIPLENRGDPYFFFYPNYLLF